MNKKPAGIDVAVLLIFFCRPEQFAQVFASVKKARPSKLFLYQDGPRADRPTDVENIAKCRAIAEDIDWECEVHAFYQEKNVGCDPSEFIAQRWAFSIVDKCIVLEDDDVADQSFYPYCKELLDRYENDERIAMICGMNHLGECHDNGCSYFFTNTGPIWGWASWRRVINSWEEHYDALENDYVVNLLRKSCEDIRLSDHLAKMFWHKSTGKAYYETMLGLSRFAQHRLCIIPVVNLIRSVGNCMESTHENVPSHWIYSLPVKALEFPLKHPRYIVNDVDYSARTMFRFAGSPSRFVLFWRWHKRLVKKALMRMGLWK